MKTPKLDVQSAGKKKVKLDTTTDNSFQAKTPATPHPTKKGKVNAGETPQGKKKQPIDFDDDDDSDLDEEVNGVPQLEEMEFEGKANECTKILIFIDSDDDLESYEDMSGEDGLSDLGKRFILFCKKYFYFFRRRRRYFFV